MLWRLLQSQVSDHHQCHLDAEYCLFSAAVAAAEHASAVRAAEPASADAAEAFDAVAAVVAAVPEP